MDFPLQCLITRGLIGFSTLVREAALTMRFVPEEGTVPVYTQGDYTSFPILLPEHGRHHVFVAILNSEHDD